jgi:hypothetical protein
MPLVLLQTCTWSEIRSPICTTGREPSYSVDPGGFWHGHSPGVGWDVVLVAHKVSKKTPLLVDCRHHYNRSNQEKHSKNNNNMSNQWAGRCRPRTRRYLRLFAEKQCINFFFTRPTMHFRLWALNWSHQLLHPFRIIDRFGFFRFLDFIMHFDILYV